MTRWFAAVDPGVQYFAWVDMVDSQLHRCGLDKREDAGLLADIPYGIIEKPRPGHHAKSTDRDIQELCIALGEYGAQFSERRYEVASSCPKPKRHAQALARLTPAELAILPKQKTKQKHILCALWIALKHAGRLTAIE